MSVDTTLIVPVEVAALAVNRATRDTATPHVFHRWITNFSSIGEGVPAEPAPFSSPEEWTGREDRLGVYLQWELPAALTRGRHDEEEGVGDFPWCPTGGSSYATPTAPGSSRPGSSRATTSTP